MADEDPMTITMYTEGAAPDWRALFGQCEVMWGSHACQGNRFHDGDHYCQDFDNGGKLHETIPHDGGDLRQYLYGSDVCDECQHVAADPSGCPEHDRWHPEPDITPSTPTG